MKNTTIDNVLRRFTPEEEFRTQLKELDNLEQIGGQMQSGRYLFDRDTEGHDILRVLEEGRDIRQVGLSASSIIRAGRLVGVSEGMLSKLGEDDLPVAFPLINHLFNKARKDFTVLVDPNTGKAVAFVPKRPSEYMAEELLDVSLEVASEFSKDVYLDKTFSSLSEGTYFSVVLPAMSDEMTPGDVIAGGFSIRDSRLGKFKLEVNTYTYRLVCSNGMLSVAPSGHIIRLRKEDLEMSLADWLAPVIRTMCDNIQGELQRIQNTTKMKVDNHSINIMSQTFREFPLPKETREALTDQAEQMTSVYDIVNLLTAEANNPEWAGTPARIRALQSAGGFITEHQSVCPHCNSLL